MAKKTEGKVFGTMNARLLSRLVGLAVAGLAAVGASNCADQREPECTVAPFASYGVRLTEVNATGSNCDVDPKADLFSVGFKNPSAIDVGLRPFVVLGSDKYADYDIPQRVALQIANMGNLQARAEENIDGFVVNEPPVYAYGRFANPTPTNDLCQVVDISPGSLTVPAIPSSQPEEADDYPVDDPETEDEDESRDFSAYVQATGDTSVSAAWSDMRVLVSTAYPGTQFEATLVYTYEVAAHETFDVDDNGYPIFLDPANGNAEVFVNDDPEVPPNADGSPPLVNAMGMPVDVALADLTLKPYSAPAYSCTRTYQAVGVFAQAPTCAEDADCAPGVSGVNPDFPVSCDTSAGVCVLNGPFLTGKR